MSAPSRSAIAAPALALPPRYPVLGVGISALTLAQARDLMLRARGAAPLGYVCLCNVHSLGEAHDDPEFRHILNSSFLTTPDGMPLVWLASRGVERVYGPDLLAAVCDAGRAVNLRHFFYGGRPGVAEALAARLEDRYPGLEVAGTFTPPFRSLNEDEFDALREQVARARPDVIWVGLSTPKQERFMAARWQQLATGLMVGVGAAFDFHSGRVRQAPRWVQRSGFEWLFRVCIEPRRLGWRYLRTNPLFLARMALQLTGLRKYPAPS